MPKSLVIVESPGKIKSIQKYLGSNYVVKASVGHCYKIEPTNTAIDIENNYKPKYVLIKGKKKVIDEIKKYAKTADNVYIATDVDREGEAIGMHIATMAIKRNNNIKRIRFQEITKSAILAAIKSPGELDEDLFNAQQARSVVDRLVGYGVSPQLWRKVCKGTSAGRVQSIGLMLIVEKQKEIDAFVIEEYWSIDGTFDTGKNLLTCSYKPKEKIPSKEEADERMAILNKVNKWTASSVKKQKKQRSPNPIFTTSTLQQFCSSQFGWDGKRTMRVAQQLYEGFAISGNEHTGLITYHRTDSVAISKEATNDVRDFIQSSFGKKYLSDKPRVYKSKKSAQEAHEGIRPTHLEYTLEEVRDSIPHDEFRLYDAIYRRFVSCQMSNASFDVTKIQITSDDNKHKFVVNGQILIFDGFLKVWNFTSSKDAILPDVNQGDELELKELKSAQHFTKPPAQYNTASLVKTLEELGIGRPSTYATIIDTLIKRNYAEKNGKAFSPTDLGKNVCAYLQESFPELMNTNYTARIESELDEIAEANKVWYNVVDEFYKELNKRLQACKQQKKKHDVSDILCPTCQKNYLVRRISKYGAFYGCDGYTAKGADKCTAIFDIGDNGEVIEKVKKEKKYLEGISCDRCGSKIVIRTSKRTGKEFGGCEKFPKCKRMYSMDGTPIEMSYRRHHYKKKK